MLESVNQVPKATRPLGDELQLALGETFNAFFNDQTELLSEIGIIEFGETAKRAVIGGKGLRPAYCYWSYVSVSGQPNESESLMRAAASLDMLHASALVHDDLIDASDTRRGQPAVHKWYESQHREKPGSGSAAAFGEAAAILLGDLLVMWSAQLFDEAAFANDRMAAARRHLAAMRTEVVGGQFLDVSAAAKMLPASSLADELRSAEQVLEFKSARYSVRRPAQIGAALAGADHRLDEQLGAFGSLIGRAFQLRDDVLGVFGDPVVTGKPAGDDLREGKRTILVLQALNSSASAAAELERVLNQPEATQSELDTAAAIIAESGALAAVERRIEDDLAAALDILQQSEITPEGRSALRELAELSVRRNR